MGPGNRSSALCRSLNHSARISHVTYVSDLAGGHAIAIDADSPTGYESGFRKLVIPERNAGSFQWIIQVQEMFETRDWTLSEVDYDNAPDGRPVRTASLYRWWLGSVAWVDHIVFGNPIGISVERAALAADPIAQILFLLVSSIFIVRHFSGTAAALFSLGFVFIFPLGTAFTPGQPGDSTLALICSAGSILALLAGLSKTGSETDPVVEKSIRRLFLAAGIIGGLCLWLGTAGAGPIVLSIAVAGGTVGYLCSRKQLGSDDPAAHPLPWRLWATAGAAVTLVAWLIDRSPSLLASNSWQSDFIHPLYSAAWLGCGEILSHLETKPKALSRRRKIILILSVLALGGLVYSVVFHGTLKAWSIDPMENRLTRLALDPGSDHLAEWINSPRKMGTLVATLVSIIILLVGTATLYRYRNSTTLVKTIAIAAGPALLALVLSTMQLGWWNQLNVLVLILATVALSTCPLSQSLRWSRTGSVLFASALGIPFVFSGLDQESRKTVDRTELETLVERHLAQWLAQRTESPGAVALAAPNVSVSLIYFGGLRALGTPYPENVDGFSVAVRLSAASTADEARALATGREVALIVHPSWDPFLEEYARLGSDEPENSFIAILNRWLPPRWLEPVAYHVPSVSAFENEWVAIFRAVEVQDNASAIGRLVEYFIDSRRGELAARAQAALEANFPGELVTHITASELAMALGDREAFARSVESIEQLIESGSDFYLTWEFRVSMTLVLANANRIEETRKQLERSLVEADRRSLAWLSTASLGRLLHLAKALNMEFPDPELHEFALSLLPDSLKEGL